MNQYSDYFLNNQRDRHDETKVITPYQTDYIKLPIEMATLAIKKRKAKAVKIFLAGQFYYSGKLNKSKIPLRSLAANLSMSTATFYRNYSWLQDRNWITDSTKWIYFRGIDRIREIENWKYRKASQIRKSDLENIEAFLVATVLTSLVDTGRRVAKTERDKGYNYIMRSKTFGYPVSIKALAKSIGISESKAFRKRILAVQNGYIESTQNLRSIKNLTSTDYKLLKNSDIDELQVEFDDIPGKHWVSVNQIRKRRGRLFVQFPNILTPRVQLKRRKKRVKHG